jgi:hypothetical protein
LINFRYHIVSLMAVFLALAVGITLGVTLVSGEANKGLAAQAEQDRKQVQTYRDQLQQLQQLDKYRDAYAAQVGTAVTAGMLVGVPVAVVAMPDAPRGVVGNVEEAVTGAGGTIATVTNIDAQVFDPTQRQQVLAALAPYSNDFDQNDAPGVRLGKVLARSLLSRQGGTSDQAAIETGNALNGKLINLDRRSDQAARLVVVVTAPASDPPLRADTLNRHVAFDVALANGSDGMVVAGPNSTGIDATDVATVRSEVSSRDLLSTVDVADLPSGISTVIMAGAEQLAGGQGHYGFHNSSDAPAPQLPIK